MYKKTTGIHKLGLALPCTLTLAVMGVMRVCAANKHDPNYEVTNFRTRCT